MLETHRIEELAESVADGSAPDWDAALGSTTHEGTRETIDQLRTVASIGRLFSSLTSGPTPSRTSSVKLPPGTTWGALRVIGHIGSGRFGDVYRAWDPVLDRGVALKILRANSEDPDNGDIVEEGRLMARVRHPNVVSIYGAQRIDGSTGLWMEFIDGRTLAAELADRGTLSAEDIVQVGIDLCRALEAVHAAGLVHRDVKAPNALREAGGRIVLGDFGTGRELQEDPQLSFGALAGTPTYLAPELFAGKPVTRQSDIYSLGTLLFHLATATYPVPGRSLRDLRDSHTSGHRRHLRSLRPDFPKRVTRVIEKAIQPDLAKRFDTAAAMARALEACRVRTMANVRMTIGAAIAITVITAASVITWRAQGNDQLPVPLAELDWILPTEFENRTGDASLDGALDYAFNQELSNSRFLNVASRARAEDTLLLMRKRVATRLDESVGIDVARRDGQIRAVVAGTVEKEHPGYAINARILSPIDGSTVSTISERSPGRNDLMRSIKHVAVRVRQTLGEPAEQTQKRRAELHETQMPSISTLQRYAQILSTTDASAEVLRQVVTENPDFVWGRILLARRLNALQSAQALEELERAVAVATPGSVDHYLAQAELDAHRAGFTVDPVVRTQSLERALDGYIAVLHLQPSHFWARESWVLLAETLGRSSDPSHIRRYVEQRPNSLRVLSIAAQSALALGFIPDAREYAKRGLALNVPIDDRNRGTASTLAFFGARAAWREKNAHSALSEVDALLADRRIRSKELNFTYGPFYFCLGLGRWDRAEQIALQMEPEVTKHRMLLVIASERGDRDAVRRHVAHLSVKYGEIIGGSDVLGGEVVSALLDAGMFDFVRQTIADMRRSPRPNHHPLTTQLFDGYLALAEGRFSEGIQLVEQYRQRHDNSNVMVMRASLRLANAIASQGQILQAITLLESSSRRAARSPSEASPAYMHVRSRLGELYRQVRRTREAEEIDSDLRQLLAAAPDEHPIKRRLNRTLERQASN